METEDTLFMPKQTRKRPSERISELETEATRLAKQRRARRRLEGEADAMPVVPLGADQLPLYRQTLILVDTDRDLERRQQVDRENRLRVHSHFQQLQPHLFVNNCLAVGQLAAYVYLDAMLVSQCCFYWLGEYNNKRCPPHLLFNDLVEGLLSHLPQLSIAGQFGLKYTQATNAYYCKKLRFCGSLLHQIPDVHFDLRLDKDERKNQGLYHPNHALLKGLGYVTQPLNRCFLAVHSPGSQAEFMADHFLYNTVLEEFFEPSFLIIALYHYALDGIQNRLLARLFEGHTVQRSLVTYAQLEISAYLVYRVKLMLLPLRSFIEQVTPLVRHTFNQRFECVDPEEAPLMMRRATGDDYDPFPPLAACIDRNDRRRVEKLRRLYCDMVALAQLLEDHTLDFTTLQLKLKEKYEEKADYCALQMPVRMQLLMDKLTR